MKLSLRLRISFLASPGGIIFPLPSNSLAFYGVEVAVGGLHRGGRGGIDASLPY